MMNGALQKYEAIRSRHELPKLVADEISIQRADGLSHQEAIEQIEKFKPTSGWFAAVGENPGVYGFALERGNFARPRGRMLEGEFARDRASLWLSSNEGTITLVWLSRDNCGEGKVSSHKVLREHMTFVASSALIAAFDGCGPQQVHYHVYWDAAPLWMADDIAKRPRRRWQAFVGFGPIEETKGDA